MRQIQRDVLGNYKVSDKGMTVAMKPHPEQKKVIRKAKRFRSAFTTEQLNHLEKQFRKFPYVNKELRIEIANFLKIEERPVKIWFQNRRMKEKKDNYKECDDETTNNPQVFGNNQLNNVPVVPSTNDQCANSLPILSPTTDILQKSSSDTKRCIKKIDPIDKPDILETTNIVIETKADHLKANYYNETCNKEYKSPFFQNEPSKNTSLLFTHIKNQISENKNRKSSAEFSIDLCKKYKQGTSSTNAVQDKFCDHEYQEKTKKLELMQSPKQNTNYNLPGEFSVKKPRMPLPIPPPKTSQPSLNNPAYYPVGPAIYAPPYISSGGVLWKPVNFVPVMAANMPSMPATSSYGIHPSLQDQSKSCKCNCHGSLHHDLSSYPPTVQNPYAQYNMFTTIPYPHTSPKY